MTEYEYAHTEYGYSQLCLYSAHVRDGMYRKRGGPGTSHNPERHGKQNATEDDVPSGVRASSCLSVAASRRWPSMYTCRNTRQGKAEGKDAYRTVVPVIAYTGIPVIIVPPGACQRGKHSPPQLNASVRHLFVGVVCHLSLSLRHAIHLSLFVKLDQARFLLLLVRRMAIASSCRTRARLVL